jgi:glyoxylase-like metal-dependent hydrolase (beta-lactamase superfamily II)
MTRLVITTVLGLTLGAAPTHAWAAQVMNTGDVAKRELSERDFPRAQQLAPGIYSYEALRSGDPGGKMTTVSFIVITTDGVVVADGQGNATQTKAMVDWIAKTTPQPIRYVVICSDHGDHTGGNSAFPAGVTYIATPASLRALAAGTNGPPAPLDTVPNKRVLRMGRTTIEILNLGRAHTGGDLSVYVPSSRALFLSEAYLHWIFPAMRSAYPSEWVRTLKSAEALDAAWYVPGHGFVDDAKTLKADLPAYRRALERVIAEATRLHTERVPCPAPPPGARAGSGGGGAAQREPCEAVAKGNWGDLRNWTLFGSQVEIAIRRVYDELDGKLPPG